MQEELLYFPDVLSLTVRLNTDRPETIFEAKSNILIPPVNPAWITSIVREAFDKSEDLGLNLKNKTPIYGKPGDVSRNIVSIIKKEFENGNANFYPWLHERINLWKEKNGLDYL
jgi:UDP-N-acetylglucosamine 2-epimerase